jgi:hypothetical protein
VIRALPVVVFVAGAVMRALPVIVCVVVTLLEPGRTAIEHATQSSLAEIVNVLPAPKTPPATALFVVQTPNVAPVLPPETSAVLLLASG